MTRWPDDSRTALRKPGSKNGARRREFYEDRNARISILAGRQASEAGYVDSRLINRRSRQNPLQTGRAIRFYIPRSPLQPGVMARTGQDPRT